MQRSASLLLLQVVALFGIATVATAQETKGTPPAPSEATAGPRPGGQQRAANPGAQSPSSTAARRRLPPDVVTKHRLDLPSGALSFTATAGKIELENAEGAPDAEIAYISYVLDGTEAGSRPVTFAVNGGPGASSAWLQIGVLGPWRLATDGPIIPSAAAQVKDNPETWLAFTDLVFIDPVGTGYSRRLAETAQDSPARETAGSSGQRGAGSRGGQNNPYWSVDGDIKSLADFVRRWLQKSDRYASPKFMVGESYGGFRGPKLVHELQSTHGVGINGMILVSPVLDFGWIGEGSRNPLNWIVRLPSYAATMRAGRGPVALADIADVETYASGEYLTDIMKGSRDSIAVRRRSERVAALTGIDPGLVLRLGGKITSDVFRRERDRAKGVVASAYDATDTILDPYPESQSNRADSGLGPLMAPFTSAMQILYGQRLNWHAEGPYQLLNTAVARAWNFGPGGRSGQEVVGDLREALALDPKLRVLVVHGLFDLVTPYFQNKLIIDQLPAALIAGRVHVAAYPGGHMFYLRDGSRTSFRDDALAVYKAALDGRGK